MISLVWSYFALASLNCDRHSPDGRRINRNNVYLSEDAPPGQIPPDGAMDHTHCFTCGRPVDTKIANIDRVRDDGIYGLFPEFVPWLDCRIVAQSAEKLSSFKKPDAQAMTQGIPRDGI